AVAAKPQPRTTTASISKPTPPPASKTAMAASRKPVLIASNDPAISIGSGTAANPAEQPLAPKLAQVAAHSDATAAAPTVTMKSAPPATLTMASAQLPPSPSAATKPEPRGDSEQNPGMMQQAATQAVAQATPAAAQPAASQPAAGNPNAAVNLAREQQQQMNQPQPVVSNRSRYSGEPIWVNLKDADLKDFFRLIHEISGLNIVLDPNVHGSLTLVLDAVPWDQALDIVLQNNQLDKQIEGNVLRIATVDTLRKEADSVRAREEAQAMAINITTYTHYLSYAHSKDVILT